MPYFFPKVAQRSPVSSSVVVALSSVKYREIVNLEYVRPV